ncbi:MAG: hypothetical protein GC161_13330 [Planctomycetaceae bacterium]|nr:hypothetical protein [Planctomycetaceae bacterium]
MPIVSQLLTLRVSRGETNSNQPPLAIRVFTLELESAEPRYVYYSDTATDEEVHLLMLAALSAKMGNMSSNYSLDPTQGTRLQLAHEIDPVDPGKWSDPTGGARALIHPLVDGSTVYYVGARL